MSGLQITWELRRRDGPSQSFGIINGSGSDSRLVLFIYAVKSGNLLELFLLDIIPLNLV